MNPIGMNRWFAATVLAAVAFVSVSCSKKDVREDEAGFNPSDTGGAAAMGEGSASAGEAGTPAQELQTVYFEFDSFSLTSEARGMLKANAQWLKDNPNSTVQVEGHCDERGTTEYNLALGEKRAKAARDYLAKMGIAGNRLSFISYGEERPSDPGHDEAAWSRNRRASFVILTQ